VGRYQKGKTYLDFTEARDSEWQWHQLGHMQVCTSLQADNHASTSLLSFLQAGCPSCRPINSVKALKAENPFYIIDNYYFILHGLLLNPDMLLHAAPRALVMRMQPVATDGVAWCVPSRQ